MTEGFELIDNDIKCLEGKRKGEKEKVEQTRFFNMKLHLI